MCEQIADKVRQEAQDWNELRISGDTGRVPHVVNRFLHERLMAIASKAAEHYNEDGPLGDAIHDAVAVGQLANCWSEELRILCQVVRVRKDSDPAESAQGASLEELVQWAKGPLALSLEVTKNQMLFSKVRLGLCTLMWLMYVKEVSISIDLSGFSLGAEGLAALGQVVAPSLVSLDIANSDCVTVDIANSDCINGDGNYSGLTALFDVVRGHGSGLKELRYAIRPLYCSTARD